MYHRIKAFIYCIGFQTPQIPFFSDSYCNRILGSFALHSLVCFSLCICPVPVPALFCFWLYSSILRFTYLYPVVSFSPCKVLLCICFIIFLPCFSVSTILEIFHVCILVYYCGHALTVLYKVYKSNTYESTVTLEKNC